MKKRKRGPDPYKRFHKKIERILREAGFMIKKSDFCEDPKIIAAAEGKRVLVQCKCAEKEETPFLRLNDLIDKYSKKVRKKNARVAILAFKRYKLPNWSLDFDKREDILKKKKVAIWDDQTVDYYVQVTRALKEYAKYPMLWDLGIEKKFAQPQRVPTIKIKQKNKEFFVFTISPELLLKIAYVSRRRYSPKAYQRIVSASRVRDQIADYLNSQEGIFPTNIVCAFKEKVDFDEKSGELSLPMQYASVWIVDGQHRLYGFCHAKRTVRENFDLICTGFNIEGFEKSKLSPEDEAKMFVTINETARRISKILLLDLYEMIGKEDRRVMVVKKLTGTKPFRGKIQTKEGGWGPISLVSFALTPPMLDLVENNGLVSRFYGKSRRRKIVSVEFCVEVLEKYFSIVQEIFKKEWKNSEKYFLAEDRGIRGMLRLLRDILEYSNGLEDEIKVKKCLRALKKNFDFRWRKGYYGEGGADQLYEEWVPNIQREIRDFGPKSRMTIMPISIGRGEVGRAEKILKHHFSKFEANVVGVLQYIDETTFRFLNFIPQSCGINLITHVVRNREKCREKAEEIRRNHPYLQIKEIYYKPPTGKPRAPAHYHRFIADNNMLLELGTDLMRNALGKPHELVKGFDRPYLHESYQWFLKMWKGTREEIKQQLGEVVIDSLI